MNKMKNILLLILTFIGSLSLYGQDPEFIDYDFTNERIEIPAEFENENEIILLLDRKVEIVATDQGVSEYILVHEMKLVNSDDAIEKNNKIYIAFDENENIVTNKNRVILADGKVITLSEDDIHEETDTETGRSYQYYAVKGLEKGAIIEQLYIKAVRPQLEDRSFIFQYSAPIIQCSFELIHPSYLGFKTKSYNGLTEPVVDKDSYTDKVKISVVDSNLVALNFETEYANHSKHRKYFRYKLHENFTKGTKNFYNYNEFAGNAFQNLTADLDKKNIKVLKKFVKDIEFGDDMFENVWAIEHLIKTKIVNDNYYTSNRSLSDVIRSKKARFVDILILYKALFNLYDIPSEFVFTTDRFDKYFDLEFETTENLVHPIFYFPDLDMFLDPKNKSLRIPLINKGVANNNGIRLKEKEFGGQTMAVAKAIFIPITGLDINTDTMMINVDFTEDITNPKITSYIEFGGYASASLQAIVDQVPEETFEEIKEDILKNYAIDAKMDKSDFLNNGFENISKNNLVFDLEFPGESLVQRAGKKYLFKFGEIIGKQTELYQTDERTIPVELEAPRHYYRVLTVKIPEGYKITNPESTEFDFRTVMDGEEEAIFVSTYEMENNKLTVTNEEFYKAVEYPVEHFKTYQAVVNAAADFNKIVLVLEKE